MYWEMIILNFLVRKRLNYFLYTINSKDETLKCILHISVDTIIDQGRI
jgi:hypothetical protein